MIDRNYDKVIILCYPAGAGGNFLINCLSLNDQCVLRDSRLAERQLHSGFTSAEKLDYFQTQLDITLTTKKWNDLGLGCNNLFGIDSSAYFFEYPEIIQKKFNYVIPQLIRNNKYLFIVAHTTQHLEACCNFWTNARTIFFTDYHKFVKDRTSKSSTKNLNLIRYWNTVGGPSWPEDPPASYHEFLQLPSIIQEELVTDFHSEIFRWIDSPPLRDDLHDLAVKNYLNSGGDQVTEWNVANNYVGNESKFLIGLHRCADWARIGINVSDSAVLCYYQNWLRVISAIKN
jgi:hypothetical protein